MGVKSLWSLLSPIGRPVLLETMEGKTMAIDSSIWLYQFQATMRDKDGRVLVNAHVLGFLRRICKLLFYGIKPVFVFDGGAPALKRATITERKKKKSGAADSHARLAEKLLAAQMRKEAIKHAQKTSGKQSTGVDEVPIGPVTIDDDAVYLEDITGPAPKTPKNKGKEKERPSSSTKKARWRDYDPYQLPDVDMQAMVAKATQSNAPDLRLATEDELRDFINEMKPEDFNLNSPAFRELPTEIKYEIIGDLRLKSRQTSYKRLQSMLSNSRTSMDFSKLQILNLKERNALTQQLLVTTDSIGQVNVGIPTRIASERNREYVIVRSGTNDLGWALGIRSVGSESQPIQIDQDEDIGPAQDASDDDSDMDMEEVVIPNPTPVPQDPDLREYRRQTMLQGLANRNKTKGSTRGLTTGHIKNLLPRTPKKSQPLFEPDDDDEPVNNMALSEDDDNMALAIQASLQHHEEEDVRQAMEASLVGSLATPAPALQRSPLKTTPPSAGSRYNTIFDLDEDSFLPPRSRLDTALSFANMGSSIGDLHSHGRLSSAFQSSTSFGTPSLLLSTPVAEKPKPVDLSRYLEVEAIPDEDSDDDDMEEVQVPDVPVQSFTSGTSQPSAALNETLPAAYASNLEAALGTEEVAIESDDDDLYADPTPSPPWEVNKPLAASQVGNGTQTPLLTSSSPPDEVESKDEVVRDDYKQVTQLIEQIENATTEDIGAPQSLLPEALTKSEVPSEEPLDVSISEKQKSLSSLVPEDSDAEDRAQSASRSPIRDQRGSSESPHSRSLSPATEASRPAVVDTHWDAAEEMNPEEEEGEFARFVSQIKGRDLDVVRREIEAEIRSLDQQRKAAMRDSEDVTQQMISQIMMMLRLFGIPYVTAPMEAEAQCAELVSLGLVDGIITDDSDVFLFGGLRVFKNMFNQSKTVECFLLSDLERELGLDREKLIRLAYLLGSDYTEGLPGVGPVIAMEILKEFPGENGLVKFREWWSKVQTGRDTAADNQSTLRKRLKKRFKEMYLTQEWPNPAVKDAYVHPTVDSSTEPFKWGLPDLDALRAFFQAELSWSSEKVDELLLPIIQRMGSRGRTNAVNKQGNLNEFFDISAGAGVYEPRKRQAYASRRLQDLVSAHRKEQKRKKSMTSSGSEETQTGAAAGTTSDGPSSSGNGDEAANSNTGGRKRRKTVAKRGSKVSRGKSGNRGRGRGRGRNTQVREESSGGESSPNDSDYDGGGASKPSPPDPPISRPRRRPKPAYQGAQSAPDVG